MVCTNTCCVFVILSSTWIYTKTWYINSIIITTYLIFSGIEKTNPFWPYYQPINPPLTPNKNKWNPYSQKLCNLIKHRLSRAGGGLSGPGLRSTCICFQRPKALFIYIFLNASVPVAQYTHLEHPCRNRCWVHQIYLKCQEDPSTTTENLFSYHPVWAIKIDRKMLLILFKTVHLIDSYSKQFPRRLKLQSK